MRKTHKHSSGMHLPRPHIILCIALVTTVLQVPPGNTSSSPYSSTTTAPQTKPILQVSKNAFEKIYNKQDLPQHQIKQNDQPRRELISDKDTNIKITPDFTFKLHKTIQINPDYLNIYRQLEYASLAGIGDAIQDIRNKHTKSCNMLSVPSTFTRYHYFQLPRTYLEAQKHCESLRMTLPEIRTRKQSFSLQQYMTENNITRTWPGIILDRNLHEPVFVSDHRKTAQTSAVPFCLDQKWTKDPILVYFYNRYTEEEKEISDFPFSYNINKEGILGYCPYRGGDNHKVDKNPLLQTICEQLPNEETETDLTFCQMRQKDIEDTNASTKTEFEILAMTLDTAVKRLQNSKLPAPLSTASRTKRDNNNEEPKTRVPRLAGLTTLGAAILAGGLGFTVITAAITGLVVSAAVTPSNQDEVLQSLTIDTQYIAAMMAEDNQKIMNYTSQIYAHNYAVNKEMAEYDFFLRQMISFKTTIDIFNRVILNIQYNQMSQAILNQHELNNLITKYATSSPKATLNPDYTAMTVSPVIYDDKLSVQIRIPIEDKAKIAHIYSALPIPTFTNNRKFLPTCKTQYIAIFENSRQYVPLSTAEFAKCTLTPNQCTIGTPLSTNAAANCLAAHYFNTEKAHERQIAKNNLPFFHTIGHTTVYSVENGTKLEFHCSEISGAGADHTKTLEGKGHFINDKDCRFEVPAHSLAFNPPRTHASMKMNTSIETKLVFNKLKEPKYTPIFLHLPTATQIELTTPILHPKLPLLNTSIIVILSLVVLMILGYCCCGKNIRHIRVEQLTPSTRRREHDSGFRRAMANTGNIATSIAESLNIMARPEQHNYSPTSMDMEEETIKIHFPHHTHKPIIRNQGQTIHVGNLTTSKEKLQTAPPTSRARTSPSTTNYPQEQTWAQRTAPSAPQSEPTIRRNMQGTLPNSPENEDYVIGYNRDGTPVTYSQHATNVIQRQGPFEQNTPSDHLSSISSNVSPLVRAPSRLVTDIFAIPGASSQSSTSTSTTTNRQQQQTFTPSSQLIRQMKAAESLAYSINTINTPRDQPLPSTDSSSSSNMDINLPARTNGILELDTSPPDTPSTAPLPNDELPPPPNTRPANLLLTRHMNVPTAEVEGRNLLKEQPQPIYATMNRRHTRQQSLLQPVSTMTHRPTPRLEEVQEDNPMNGLPQQTQPLLHMPAL